MWDTLNSILAYAIIFLISLLLAAIVIFANFQIPVSQAVLPVAILTYIFCLSVLVPFVVVLVAGRRAHKILHVRYWQVRHGDQLSFGSALG